MLHDCWAPAPNTTRGCTRCCGSWRSERLAFRPLAPFADPDDLPRLGAMTDSAQKEPVRGPAGTNVQVVRNGAVPYLKTALRVFLRSRGRFTSQIGAATHGGRRCGGFSIRRARDRDQRRYRMDMLQDLRSRFPELKAADDDAIAAFIKARDRELI